MQTSMADWSELPSELLQLISKKLNNNELYLLRFRSVCSSWRTSSIRPNHLHVKLPQLSGQLFHQNPNIDSVSHLMKHNIYLIKPQKPQHHPWLIRIGPDSNGKLHLWHPFSIFPPLPIHPFIRVIDFTKLSVFDLGHVFYIHHTTASGQNSYSFSVVPMGRGEQPLVIITLKLSGDLIMFRCGDSHWTTVPNMSISQGGNMCVFKGQPCIVDKTGRTVMIGPDLTTHLMVEPVFGGESKHLVESSEFGLLLVDSYLNHGVIVWIDVFRLAENEKKWVMLTNLGDTVLFLGIGCSFSSSASDLGFANGNCVIYNRDYLGGNTPKFGWPTHIFHLDQGRVSLLSNYPDYFKLLWPTPEWIAELNS